MVSITVDGQLAHSLSDVTERIEIVDADGRLLGYFNPMAATEIPHEVLAGYDPEKSRKRLEENDGTWITKDELFARLDARLPE